MGKFYNFKVLSVDDILPTYNLMLTISNHSMEILKTATQSSIRPTAQNFSIKDFFSKYDQIRWGNYSGELLTYNNDKAENFSERIYP